MSQAGRFNGSNNGGTVVETLTGNVGGPVPPDGLGNIDVIGDGTTVTVTGNPGTNTLTISAGGLVATQYDADVGSAAPAAGVLNVLGGDNMNTDAAGNTVNINLNETIHWPDTNGAGTTGVIYLGGAGGAGGQRFLHNFGPAIGVIGNAFLGRDAGNFTGTGTTNIGIGSSALLNFTTGSQNVSVGNVALSLVLAGSNNVAVGTGALQGISNGSGNTAVGDDAGGLPFSDGSFNTFIGTSSGPGLGPGQTGDYNICVGYHAGFSLQLAESSNIYIGNSGTAADNNTMRLGTHGSGNGEVNRCFIGGIDGVNVGSVATIVSFDPIDDQIGMTEIVGGTGITVTPGANTITISGSGTSTLTVTLVNTSPYVVLTTDQYLSVDCSGGTITIQLPNAPATGRTFTIKDRTGSANTNNITVTTVGGVVLLDGATTYVMNTQYSAINVIFNGTAYEIY